MKNKETRKEIMLGFRARMHLKSNWIDRFADFTTSFFGTAQFLIANLIIFLAWILVNMGFVPFVTPFDPYPFEFLTMVVSLEAIFLSVIVLMSQNRAGNIADLREEMDFEINIRSENEITRILNMLDEIHDHLGLENSDDIELEEMKQTTDIEKLGADYMEARNGLS